MTSISPKRLTICCELDASPWSLALSYFDPGWTAMPVVMKRCRKTKTSMTGSIVTTVIASR